MAGCSLETFAARSSNRSNPATIKATESIWAEGAKPKALTSLLNQCHRINLGAVGVGRTTQPRFALGAELVTRDREMDLNIRRMNDLSFAEQRSLSESCGCSRTNSKCPSHELRPQDDEQKADRLNSDEWDGPTIDLRCGYFRRRDAPQVEERKPERRGKE